MFFHSWNKYGNDRLKAEKNLATNNASFLLQSFIIIVNIIVVPNNSSIVVCSRSHNPYDSLHRVAQHSRVGLKHTSLLILNRHVNVHMPFLGWPQANHLTYSEADENCAIKVWPWADAKRRTAIEIVKPQACTKSIPWSQQHVGPSSLHVLNHRGTVPVKSIHLHSSNPHQCLHLGIPICTDSHTHSLISRELPTASYPGWSANSYGMKQNPLALRPALFPETCVGKPMAH